MENKKGISKITIGLIVVILIAVIAIIIALTSGGSEPENNIENGGSTNNNVVENNNNQTNTNGNLTIDAVKNARETDASKFEYDEVEGGIAITNYIGNDKIVSIPSTIDGKKVVEIGYRAFAYNKNIEGLYLGENVTTIAKEVFMACLGLKVVVYGPYVKTTNTRAFAGCEALTTVVLNEGLETLENSCFAFTKISELTIPDSVTVVEFIFTYNSDITRRIIASKGTAAEQYVIEYGEDSNLVFQEK